MIIKKRNNHNERIVLDLTGPDGNAFVILGIAKNLCKKLNMDWEVVSKKMMAGDYENLIAVFEDYFGDFVTMYR